MEVSDRLVTASLPADWHAPTIRDVCRLINGRGFKPYEWRKAGLPIIRIQNLNGSDDFNYYQGSFDKKIEVEPGQLLFAWSGSRGTSFGPHIWSGPRGVLNYHTWKVDVDRNAIDVTFFLHALRQLTAFIEGKAHGASALVHTQKWEMEGFAFPAPQQLPEQQAIAHALSDIDDLIQSLEQLIAKKRDLKQAAMQQLLTGQTRLPGFSGEWRSRLLGEVVAHCSSGATPYRGRKDYYQGRIKWITSGELNYNVITETIEHISEKAKEETHLTMHPVGTFLMAITGLEAAGTRGACGIVGSPATTNQSCMAIYPSDELLSRFLFHFYRLRGDSLALRYCQGTKQQSYTAALVRRLPIELPPTFEEQAAIAEVLSDMDAEIEALEARLTKTRDLKQGMMQELLTGRTRLV
jgi:type I restriction enzyme S subunit